MAQEIAIPRLGWSMEEGTFREWLKTSGEKVSPGEMLCVLEGEKAAQEIESIDGGILWFPPDAPRPDDVVKVGQVIGYLLAVGEPPPKGPTSAPPVSTSNSPPVDVTPFVSAIPKSRSSITTPRAQRRAKELSVDWKAVSGTGKGGRIRERDVLAFVSERKPSPPKLRQAIAHRMLEGVHQTAPVTLTTTKADATELVRWRNLAKANADLVPSYTEMLVKIVATLLPECPALNACWQDNSVLILDGIHISIAVDTGHGLLAPVLAHTDRLSLQEITCQFRSMVERARLGTLSQKELQGGTFTITNLGTFDIDFFTPIINLPQAAILGIGRIAREPVIRGDAIVIGETIGLSLTFDHRVIDGAPAARWLQRLCQAIGRAGEILDHAR